MKILIIDGQGGKLGKQLVESILAHFDDIEITAVGTNEAATEAMIKGGTKLAATGENAVIVGCRKADLIIGPIGIILADSMLGEISPAMAIAVAQSNATRILLPVNKCNNLIAGIKDMTTASLIADTLDKIKNFISNKTS